MIFQTLVYGVAVVVGGLGTAGGLLYVVTKLARAFGEDDTTIPPPVPRFGKLSAKDADTVRAAAKARQTRADHHHAEGRQIESGEPGTDRIIHLINGRGPRR